MPDPDTYDPDQVLREHAKRNDWEDPPKCSECRAPYPCAAVLGAQEVLRLRDVETNLLGLSQYGMTGQEGERVEVSEGFMCGPTYIYGLGDPLCPNYPHRRITHVILAPDPPHTHVYEEVEVELEWGTCEYHDASMEFDQRPHHHRGGRCEGWVPLGYTKVRKCECGATDA